ncbi:unnamed protein product [Paramecium sonneborni]|uniref:Uncharacterized protein n=1 Tax=Paramecium sonneborni TaxID=65129 RepID=A0A8S1P058_9CILI|nr:unnamed protein product [Paramecium sonneborni]
MIQSRCYAFQIFFLMLSTTFCIEPSKICVCGHIQTREICLKSSICIWDNEKCVIKSGLKYLTSKQDSKLCQSYENEECRRLQHCGFHLGKCIDFGGCEMYNKDLCEVASFQCVSDGIRCIKIRECINYLSQIECNNKSKKGTYCVWKKQESIKCQDVDKCEDLPIYLTDHKKCNESLEGCTVNAINYGCIRQMESCSEYMKESQCYSTLNNRQICFWLKEQKKCLEKICDNFPFKTDYQCKSQLNECTTNGIHCVIRKACQDAKMEAGCVTDNLGNICQYYQGECQNKTCYTALNLFNNYNQCQEYDKDLDCVTSEKGGCKPRPTMCSGYIVVIDCYSIKSQDCIWINNKCEKKQCHHAPTDYAHSDCKLYGNCIGKTGGGCETTPKDCENISNQLFCDVNSSSQQCIWTNNQCVLLICNQLTLPDYQDHKSCQKASTKCTYNFQFQGCTDFTCENVQEADFCKIDSQGNSCSLNQGCILKQCKTAPSTYKTHQECEEWMSECTVQLFQFASTKASLGCVKKNIDCQFYQQEQCYTTIEGYKCIWNSSLKECQYDNCSSADINLYNKNEDCANFKIFGQQCIIETSGYGCQNWPTSCNDMKIEDQCKLNLQNGTQCFWSGTICKLKECSDAINTEYTNNIECNQWMDDCIYNQIIGGCQTRPSNLECFQSPNTTMYDSHQKCYAWNPKCTVIDNFKSEGCIKKLEQCSQYTRVSSCKSTIAGDHCYWDDLKQKCQIWDFDNNSIPDCQNRIYGDLSHQDCQSFLSKCTLGNFPRSCTSNNKTTCSYFKEQQCVVTVLQQPCQWDYTNKLCKSVQCIDNTTATTDSECLRWRRNYECQLKINQNGSFGPGCENRPEDCQQIKDSTICNLTFTLKGQSCFYIQKNKKCQLLTADNSCELVTFAKSNEQCQYYQKNCILQQEGQNCISFVKCSNLSQNTCGKAEMSFNQRCAYSSNYCRSNNNCSDIEKHQSACDNKLDGFKNRCQFFIYTQFDIDGNLFYQYQCQQYTNDIQIRAQECQKFSADYYYYKDYCKSNSNCDQLSVFGKDICNSGNLSSQQLCGYNSSTNKCENRKCEHLNLPTLESKDCFDWNYDCVLSNNGCIKFSGNDCSQIKLIYQCLQYSQCKWQTGNCVNNINCEINTTALFNYECLLISPQLCRLNYNFGQGCAFLSCSKITDQILCNSANTSDGQSCKWVNTCISKLCQDYTTQVRCSENYQSQIFQSQTVLIKCYWCNGSCITNNFCDSSISNPPIQHSDCYKLNPMQTISISFINKCTLKKNSCQDYTYQAACVITINDIKCYWEQSDSKCYDFCKSNKTGPYDHIDCVNFDNQCMSLNNTCQLLDCSILTNEGDCQIFSQKCFWDGTLCQTVRDCSNFHSPSLCTQNSDGKACFWDGTICVEKQCSNRPSTSQSSTECNNWLDHCVFDSNTSSCIEDCESADYSYTTHEQCEDFYPNKICTLKPGLIQCVQLPLSCSIAKKTQCFKDILGNQCYYLKTTNQCVNLQCSILEDNTHIECNQKLKTCTVNATLNGCQLLDQCNNYVIQEQCKIDLLYQECEWINNQNKCTLKNCTTAQLSIYSVNTCQQYFYSKCTVNQSFDGCVIPFKSCSEYSLDQCQSLGQINYDGISCFWDEQKKKCQDKICINGPPIALNDAECIDYLNVCQRGGCRIKNCYDFYYPFDSACASIFENKSCTTNGFQCVLREQCENVLIQDGCTYDINLQPCIWLNNKCQTKTCETAPETLNKHQECESYLLTCTVKKEGGCIQKKACEDNLIKKQCHSDIDNQECVWDDQLNQCFINQCIGFCGDGIIQNNEEQCDDGNYIPYDGCYQCQFQCSFGCIDCDQGQGCKKCDNQFILNYETEICQEIKVLIDEDETQNIEESNEIIDQRCGENQIFINFQCVSQCGNGVLNSKYEQCDDGNQIGGDGCSSFCSEEDSYHCRNQENATSTCSYILPPDLIIASLSSKTNQTQLIELSFTQNVKLTANLNFEEIAVITIIPDTYASINIKPIVNISTSFNHPVYQIIVELIEPVNNPVLQIDFVLSMIKNEFDLDLVRNQISIKLGNPFILPETTHEKVTQIMLLNEIMIYSMIAISGLTLLTGNTILFFNLLELLQSLSYIKFMQYLFPPNLVQFLNTYTKISLKPILDYFHIEDILKSLNGGSLPFYSKKKLDQNQTNPLNQFYLLNAQSCYFSIFCSLITFFICVLLTSQKVTYLLKRQFRKFQNNLIYLRCEAFIFRKVQNFCLKFKNEYYSFGIIKVYQAILHQFLFSVLLQFPEYHFNSPLMIFNSINAIIGLVIVSYIGLQLLSITSLKIKDQKKWKYFYQDSKAQFWAANYKSFQIYKTMFYIFIIVEAFEYPQIQSILLSMSSLFNLGYILKFRPLKSKYEYSKIISREFLFALITGSFLIYSFSFNQNQHLFFGWIHISFFSLMLVLNLSIDLIECIKNGWINYQRNKDLQQIKEQKKFYKNRLQNFIYIDVNHLN